MGVLGLAKKDLLRPEGTRKVDELGCRQMAFALSGVHEGLTAYDLYELGGELEPRLHARRECNSSILQIAMFVVFELRKA